MQKIALIEFGGSHTECLLSQFYALKSQNYHITFIGTKALWEENKFLHPYADAAHFIQFDGKMIGDFRKALALNLYLKNNKISKAVFNTAQGGHVRNMCLFAPKSVEFFGIIHTLNKFRGSFTQKLISKKIKKYFVLNDFFKDQLQNEKGLKIESFYPLRFPHFEKEIGKPEGEIWVTIIGGVENRRKDLIGSIPLMQKLPRNYRFIFLGKSDGKKEEVQFFHQKIKEAGLENVVVTFPLFVSDEEFDAYLKKTDFIWPMVHPNTPSAGEYFRNQIPGAINAAFAYKIPLWIHEEYAKIWKDLENSISYSLETFDLVILAEKPLAVKTKMEAEMKFDAEFQEGKYLSFLAD